MIRKVYSIRDAKAECFNNPFLKLTHGEAERDFTQAVNDTSTMLNKFPEDYDLYFLGEFDDNSGKMITSDTPLHVVKAIQVIRPSGPTGSNRDAEMMNKHFNPVQ